MAATHDPTPTPEALPAERDVLLLDQLMPAWDAALRVTCIADADAATTWEAARTVDLMRVRTPLTAAAFWARDLWDRIARSRRGDAPAPEAPETVTFESGLPGWTVLGEQPGHEIVFGAIGRFWTGEITWHDPVAPEEFTSFTEAGWGRIAAGFSVRPYGADRALLTYDVRTDTTDLETQGRFLRYWTLVRPFVRHIMRATTSMIATDAAAARPERVS